ncbi:MAG: hypothetical protein ACTSP7_03240 [Candidatus Heimdallarchaeota archaeon]
MPRRYDAELLKTSKYREIEYMLMPTRTESTNYYDKQLDLTKTFEFLEKYNKGKKEEEKATVFHIFLTTCLRTAVERHKINRFVSGSRLWQRNELSISFVVKKEGLGEQETIAKIIFDPYDTLADVVKRVNKRLNRSRKGDDNVDKDVKLFSLIPRFVFRFLFWFGRWTEKNNMPIKLLVGKLPMFCTYFVANLGSLKIDAVYHHLYELGNSGVFITYGPFYKAAVVDQKTEEISVKTVMDMRVSIDDRFAGGAYTGPACHFLESGIIDPEHLTKKPELTDEQLDRLMLKKYKKERLAREKQRKKEARQQKKKKK